MTRKGTLHDHYAYTKQCKISVYCIFPEITKNSRELEIIEKHVTRSLISKKDVNMDSVNVLKELYAMELQNNLYNSLELVLDWYNWSCIASSNPTLPGY